MRIRTIRADKNFIFILAKMQYKFKQLINL